LAAASAGMATNSVFVTPFPDDGQVDARGGDRVTGDEALRELAADRAAVVVLEVPQAGVEPAGSM